MREVKENADQAVDRAAGSPWVERMARWGMVVRGTLYVIVGVIAVRVALGRGDRADKQGALRALGHQPFGRVLLLAMAVGFAGYALWRFVEAAAGPPGAPEGRKGLLKRLGCAARGVLYTASFVSAARLVASPGRGDNGAQASWTARALGWPGGPWLVRGAGLAVMAIGLYSGWRALSQSFGKRLKTAEMTRTERRWIVGLGSVGMVARMVVTMLVGLYLLAAARHHDPREAVGVDGALKRLAARPYGLILLLLVAFGLAAYGVYSLAEARYRRVGTA